MMNIDNNIQDLKKERNAVILAHNYQRPEVQDIADFVGDSLELSLIARDTRATTVVFCGVKFMAETAKILSPDKTILLPEIHAGCPLADMISPTKLIELKKQNPGVPVVCYINSSIETKMLSDICCTSANGLKIVNSIPGDSVIFIPDEGLGSWIAEQTDKKVILFHGYCPTHYLLTKEDFAKARAKYPGVKTIVHPECPKEIRDLSDLVAGTGGMIRLARELPDQRFLIGTEEGMIHRLKKTSPDKEFILLSTRLYCPNMKKTTLSSVEKALEENQYEITVPMHQITSAKKMLDNMFGVK
jgi:quinolinate synthase